MPPSRRRRATRQDKQDYNNLDPHSHMAPQKPPTVVSLPPRHHPLPTPFLPPSPLASSLPSPYTTISFTVITTDMASSAWAEETPFIDQPNGASQAEDDPGRPRNAWIIFRSAELADRKARGIRKSQADFSRELSLIWKGMSADEKRPYEIAAELEKAEHKRLHPNYRFRPKKREEKARLKEELKVQKAIEREENKKKKSRPAPYIVPPKGRFIAAPDSDAESYPPTPPLDMRRSLTPALSSRHVSAEAGPSQSHSRIPSGSPQPPSFPPTPSGFATTILPGGEVVSLPIEIIERYRSGLAPHDVAQQGDWGSLQQPTPHPSNDGDSDYPDFSNIDWSQVTSAQPPQNDAQTSATTQPMEPLPLSFTTFEMPALPKSDESSPENSYDDDQYRAILATTGDRTVFQVGGIDQDLCIPPPASLDIEVEQYRDHLSSVDTSHFDSLFADIDFSTMPESDFRGLAGAAFSQSVDSPAAADFNSTLFGASMHGQVQHGQVQGSPSDYGADMMQYINTEAESSTRFVSFDDHACTPSLIAPLSTSHMLNVDLNGSNNVAGYVQETNTFVPYAPPAGASNVGARRVAGSWKKTAIPDSPVQSRSSSWAVSS